MPYPTELKYFALGKEITRGIAVAPTRYIPVGADSEFEYKLNLIPDELLRGVMERFQPQAGTKEGTGRITGMDVTSENCGEFFKSLLGNSTIEDIGGTGGAYKHTFTKLQDVRMPSYTFHIWRGASEFSKQYPLSVVKSITLTGTVDGKITLDADILFKTEEAEAFTLSPSWPDPKPFVFHQTQIKIDGVAIDNIRDWTLTIDNQSVAYRTLNGSQDVKDILTFLKLLVNGGFTIFFEDMTQRNKFLSRAEASLEIIMTGEGIETGYNHQLKIILPRIHYEAFPFSNIDGLLGASATFNAFYKPTAGQTIQIELINTVSTQY